MTLEDLCREAGLMPPPGTAEISVTGICSDSRIVKPGELFVALRGLRVDARRYIADAVRRGAAGIVTEGGEIDGTEALPVLYVDNARIALARLLDAWYGHPGRRLRLVGVTGTNGKTTVACLLRHLLEGAGMRLAGRAASGGEHPCSRYDYP